MGKPKARSAPTEESVVLRCSSAVHVRTLELYRTNLLAGWDLAVLDQALWEASYRQAKEELERP